MNSRYLFLILLATIAFLPNCKKRIKQDVNPSAMLALSNSKIVELVSILAAPDGGFVVGANTWKNGNKDFWISKYNNKFELQWERVIGGVNDETLQKIFVDKDNYVLAAGISNGFGQDTLPPNLNKKLVLFFHYLNPNGSMNWETNYPFSTFNNFGFVLAQQRISDISQDANGEFVFTCQRAHKDQLNVVGLVPILVKLSKQGVFIKSYWGIISNPYTIWPAVFETDNAYTVFWNGQFPYKAGFYEILSDSISSLKSTKSAQWNWGEEPNPPNLIHELKLKINDNLLSYNYFFKNEVFRYSYMRNSKTISGNSIPLGVDNLFSVSSSYDNHLLLSNTNGTFYEKDADLKTLNSFETHLFIQASCKLTNGNFVLGIQADNSTLFLAHYNQYGKLEIPN